MKTQHLLAMVFTGLNLCCYAAEDATFREKQVSMPTYPFSDPNPVANPTSLCYPYFTFEGYADKSTPKEWKVVELENDYIKLSIFPEVGGKIWGAVEKSTGNEFIYHNHAVKFRQVAMRGPWTSGGIEFNFGIIGHTPTTSSPVDYQLQKNPDGSVSCFVGATDLITGGNWCVEIKLEKDKAYFVTRVLWDNPTGLQQPYYHWMNAGYAAKDDLKFFFPGSHWVDHEGGVFPWSKDNGKNLDHYAENDFGGPKFYHVTGRLSDYYGAYYDNQKFGSVHASDFNDKLGMKIWIWGLSRQGMIWEDLLTDKDGQYVELQSGRVFNQPIEGSSFSSYRQPTFEPYDTNRWNEYWYPVIGTEGMVKANRYGALNVQKKGDHIKLLFSPMQKLDEDIIVKADNKIIYEGKLQGDVLKLWTKDIPVKVTDNTKVSVKIGDDLLNYQEDDADDQISAPPYMAPEEATKTFYGQYMIGRQRMNTKKYEEAARIFEECLQKDPYFAPALVDLAEIQYRQGHYDKSIETVTRARNFDAYNAGANFVFGLSSAALGKTGDAKYGFSVASTSPAYRSAAYTELAKEFVKDQNWNKSEYYLKKALETNQFNAQAAQVLCTVARKRGNQDATGTLRGKLLTDNPLNHIARFEEALAKGGDQKSLDEFIKGIRAELPYEVILNVADWYESMNDYDDALAVLSLEKAYPIAFYRAANILHKMGKDDAAKAKLAEAKALSPDLVMPHGQYTLNALRWANTQDKGWPTSYYTGVAEWSSANSDKASKLFDECGNDVNYAPFYMCRAQLKEGQAQLDDLNRAEKLEESWRVGIRLIQYYYDQHMNDKAYAYAKKYAEKYPKKNSITLKYAQTMVQQGKYLEALDYLATQEVLPNEGSLLSRIVYRDSCLLQAIEMIKKDDYKKALEWVEKSKEWPENLGVGKPYDADIDYRMEDYIAAYCYEKLGDQAKANKLYQQVIDSKQLLSPNSLLKGLALNKLGKKDEGTKWIDEYAKQGTPLGPYVKAAYEGDMPKANEALKSVPAITVGDWVEKSERSSDLTTVKAVADLLNKK